MGAVSCQWDGSQPPRPCTLICHSIPPCFVPAPGHVPLLLSHCGHRGVSILPEWSSGVPAEPLSLSPPPPALSTCFSPVELEGWGIGLVPLFHMASEQGMEHMAQCCPWSWRTVRESTASPVPLDRHLQTHTEKGNCNLIKDTECKRLHVWGQPQPHHHLSSPHTPCEWLGRLAPWG